MSSFSDPIADLLTRVRNAIRAAHTTVEIPTSKVKLEIVRILQEQGYIDSFDVEDDKHWRANVKIPLGLGSLRLSINFEKTEERAPDFARLHAKGTGVGALMDMDTQFNLSESDGATAMAWEADVRIAGPVGSMGQRVLQPIVNQQVGHVLRSLEAQVGASAAEAPSADS